MFAVKRTMSRSVLRFQLLNLKFEVNRSRAITIAVLSTCAALACAALASCARLGAEPVRGETRERESTGQSHGSSVQYVSVEALAELTDEEQAINRRPLALPLVAPEIVIEKKARRLTLFSRGARVRVFHVALGFSPEGDKEREGDGRTPEGSFYVCVKNDKSNFYLSLGLSYPNEEDAERGLRDGIITRAEAARIRRAIRRGAKPPWNTALGGEIFIHGGGASSDWTAGCIALINEQIKELFDSIPLGTQVVIIP